jgi:hypothetical protein
MTALACLLLLPLLLLSLQSGGRVRNECDVA